MLKNEEYKKIYGELKGWQKVFFNIIYNQIDETIFTSQKLLHLTEKINKNNISIIDEVYETLSLFVLLEYINYDSLEDKYIKILNFSVKSLYAPYDLLIEDIYSDYPEFIKMAKLNNKKIFSQLSSKFIFKYIESNPQVSSANITEIYLYNRFYFNRRTNSDYPHKIVFEDYYMMIYYMNKVINNIFPNKIKEKIIIENLKKYSSQFDNKLFLYLLTLDKIYIGKNNSMPLIFFKEYTKYQKAFIRYNSRFTRVRNKRRILEIDNKIKYKDDYKNKLVFGSITKVESRYTKKNIIKKSLAEKKAVPIVTKAKDLYLFDIFLKGEITHGYKFKDIMNNISNNYNFLQATYKCNLEDYIPDKIKVYYNTFYDINKKELNRYYEKNIAKKELEICLASNQSKYNNKIEKQQYSPRLNSNIDIFNTFTEDKINNIKLKYIRKDELNSFIEKTLLEYYKYKEKNISKVTAKELIIKKLWIKGDYVFFKQESITNLAILVIKNHLNTEIGLNKSNISKLKSEYFKIYNNSDIFLINDEELFNEIINSTEIGVSHNGNYKHIKQLNKENNKYIQEIVTLRNINQKELSQFINNYLKKIKLNYIKRSELNELSMKIQKEYNETANNIISVDKINKILETNLYIKGSYYFINEPKLFELVDVVISNHLIGYKTEKTNYTGILKDTFYKVFLDNSIYQEKDQDLLKIVNKLESKELSDKNYLTKTLKCVNDIEKSEIKFKSIYNYIQEKKIVAIEGLFDKFKNDITEIKDKEAFKNRIIELFQGLFYNDKFIGTNKNLDIDILSIISEYSKEFNGVVNINDMISNNSVLNDTMYKEIILTMVNYIPNSLYSYIHESYLKEYPKELRVINNYVIFTLNKDDKIHIKDLFVKMKDITPNTIKENNINEIIFAYGYFKYKFPGIYLYDYPYIRRINRDFRLSTYEVIISNFFNRRAFNITELQRELKENKVPIASVRNLLELFYEKGFIRLNEKMLGKYSEIKSEELINTMDEVNRRLLFLLNQNVVVDFENYNFNLLPQLKHSWNKHLLAHLVKKTSEIINVDTRGNQYNNLQYVLTKKESLNERI